MAKDKMVIIDGSAFFRCPRCKENKKRSEFYSSNTKYGITTKCKECSKEVANNRHRGKKNERSI